MLKVGRDILLFHNYIILSFCYWTLDLMLDHAGALPLAVMLVCFTHFLVLLQQSVLIEQIVNKRKTKKYSAPEGKDNFGVTILIKSHN